MQKISFGNKDYVKASAIAKQFRYTQDYVGQLCRNDKVDARLVGRVWYVNPDSVTEYRKTKHASLKTKPVAKQAGPRRKVEPVIRNKTIRTLEGKLRKQVTSDVRVHEVTTHYDKDDQAIIPIVNTSNKDPVLVESTQVSKIKPAPKVRIKVKPKSKKSTVYSAGKLPEITLKAKLNVSDYTGKQLLSEEEVKPATSDDLATVYLGVESQSSDKTNAQSQNPSKLQKKEVKESKVAFKANFKPNSVATTETHEITKKSWSLVLITICAAFIISVVMLSLADSVTVFPDGVTSEYSFTSNLVDEFLNTFF